MKDTQTAKPQPASPLKWFITFAVPSAEIATGLYLMFGFQRWELFDPAGSNIASLVSIGVAVIFAMGWFRFFANVFPLRARKIFFRSELAIIALLLLCFRVDGVNGDLTLRVVPRFAKRHDAKLDKLGDRKPTTNIDLRATTDHDSPQFWGPQRNGHVPNPGLVADWKANPPKELWRNELGAGWASFAVVGNYAVTMEQRGDQELTVCYQLDNGKTVWSHEEHARFAETVELGGPGPRSTPTIDNGRVYSLGACGILNCLDGADGHSIWHHDLQKEDEFSGTLPMYGMPCSPLVVDGMVIVATAGGSKDASLVAFDAETGTFKWKAGKGLLSYSSPIVMTLAGQRQIVKVNAQSITGYSFDGKVLWDAPWPESGNEPTVSQPAQVAENELLISKGYGIGAFLLVLSKDDQNWSFTRKWANTSFKTKFSSVVVHDGYVYGLSEQLLTCLDPQTGQVKWKNRGSPAYNYGQLLLVDDMLLVQTEPGDAALVAADPTGFREITRFTVMKDKTWSMPVLAGNKLLMRNDREAACFELPVKEEAKAK